MSFLKTASFVFLLLICLIVGYMILNGCLMKKPITDLCSEAMGPTFRCVKVENCATAQESSETSYCGPGGIGICCSVISKQSLPHCGIRSSSLVDENFFVPYHFQPDSEENFKTSVDSIGSIAENTKSDQSVTLDAITLTEDAIQKSDTGLVSETDLDEVSSSNTYLVSGRYTSIFPEADVNKISGTDPGEVPSSNLYLISGKYTSIIPEADLYEISGTDIESISGTSFYNVSGTYIESISGTSFYNVSGTDVNVVSEENSNTVSSKDLVAISEAYLDEDSDTISEAYLDEDSDTISGADLKSGLNSQEWHFRAPVSVSQEQKYKISNRTETADLSAAFPEDGMITTSQMTVEASVLRLHVRSQTENQNFRSPQLFPRELEQSSSSTRSKNDSTGFKETTKNPIATNSTRNTDTNMRKSSEERKELFSEKPKSIFSERNEQMPENTDNKFSLGSGKILVSATAASSAPNNHMKRKASSDEEDEYSQKSNLSDVDEYSEDSDLGSDENEYKRPVRIKRHVGPDEKYTFLSESDIYENEYSEDSNLGSDENEYKRPVRIKRHVGPDEKYTFLSESDIYENEYSEDSKLGSDENEYKRPVRIKRHVGPYEKYTFSSESDIYEDQYAEIGNNYYGYSEENGPRRRRGNPQFIVGGRVEHQPWPWIVAIYLLPSMRFVCAGTLFDERHILSAAHCFQNENYNDTKRLRVTIGHLRRTDKAKKKQDVSYHKVQQLFVHKEFTLGCYCNDIAILRLEKHVGPEYTPVCIPETDPGGAGETSTVLGWGDTAFLPDSSEEKGGVLYLRRIDGLTIYSEKECQEIISKVAQQKMPKHFGEYYMCAGVPGGEKDACVGDSGGPLMFEDYDGIWSLIGIVSFGYKCATPGVPGAYSRVSYYLPWITKTVDSE